MTVAPARDTVARRDAAIAALLACAKIGVSIALVSWLGFRQISDDDYARTVIAESFARAPKLDPSGTSWLPFPFWTTGAAMMAFGRSLGVARAVAYAASGVGAAVFFLALRRAGASRAMGAAATIVASVSSWNLWVGAAPVPEGFTGSLMAAAMLGLVRKGDDAAPAWLAPAALALVCALSRYEAWPMAAVIAIAAALGAWRGPRGVLVAAALAAAGPLAWMLWNRIDHGSALHFVARVTRYRHAIGAAGAPLSEKIALYPAAFVRGFPEAAVLGALGLAAAVRAPQRFGPCLVAAGAVLAFLIVGELGEGAPTHHPERALVSIGWLGVALGALALDALRARPNDARPFVRVGSWVAAGAAMLLLAIRAPDAIRAYPGQGEADRAPQIARGLALRAADPSRTFVVTPCAYEHFAVMAASGAPERFTVRAPPPDARRPVTPECPTIEP